jgi:hypothetical protein
VEALFLLGISPLRNMVLYWKRSLTSLMLRKYSRLYIENHQLLWTATSMKMISITIRGKKMILTKRIMIRKALDYHSQKENLNSNSNNCLLRRFWSKWPWGLNPQTSLNKMRTYLILHMWDFMGRNPGVSSLMNSTTCFKRG